MHNFDRPQKRWNTCHSYEPLLQWCFSHSGIVFLTHLLRETISQHRLLDVFTFGNGWCKHLWMYTSRYVYIYTQKLNMWLIIFIIWSYSSSHGIFPFHLYKKNISGIRGFIILLTLVRTKDKWNPMGLETRNAKNITK